MLPRLRMGRAAGFAAVTNRRGPMSPLDDQPCRIIICHPELLLGQAVAAAAAANMDLGAEPTVVTSSDALLARVGDGFDLALVADMVGDDLGELLEALAYRDSNLPVLVLCRHRDFRAAAQALEWGAVGSVSSASSLDHLSRAITMACKGFVVFLDDAGDEVRQALEERHVERSAADAVYRALTDRERILVRQLAGGRTAGEIAGDLQLSPHTIRAAIRTLGDKLDTRGQLRIAAASRELLQAITPPSRRFEGLAPELRADTRAG